MIADDWTKRNRPRIDPFIVPYPAPSPPNWDNILPMLPQVSRQEFDDLKKEVEKLREDLIKAKKQDEEDGNPDCEMEEKIEFLRKVADFVGVPLEDILRAQS
jgi:hypothetical protein